MQKCKFKFTKLISTFIYIGIALAAAAFITNTVLIVLEKWDDAKIIYSIIQYALMYFVSVLLFIILISLRLSSFYSIENTTLKTNFGIIKSKYDILKIESILLDRTTDKLSIYFDNQNFIVIAVKEDWYGDFTDAILKANPKIEFSIKSKENSDKENKDKK